MRVTPFAAGGKDAAEATVTAAGMRIVRLLVGCPPQTVSDLIATTGVTRTAVTEQLNELVAAGFVERTLERLPGRGRPRHLYRATNAALLLLFASQQNLVVPALWQAIEETGGPEMTSRVVRRASALVANHYRQRLTAQEPSERLRQLAAVMEEEGGLVEVVGDNTHVVMRKRSCAFIGMFDDSRSICRLDTEMLSEVVGCPVRRVSCRHDGDACCTFEIGKNSSSG